MNNKTQCETCQYWIPLSTNDGYSKGMKACHYCYKTGKPRKVKENQCLSYKKRKSKSNQSNYYRNFSFSKNMENKK